MYAGAASAAGLLITLVVTTRSVHSAVLRSYPALTAAQWHGVALELTVKEWTAPLAVGLWLWLAWANGRGNNWARPVFAAFYGVMCLVTLYCLSQGAPVYAPADFAVGLVELLIATVALTLLLRSQASRHYRPAPVLR
jgi:hypothetical protein